MGWVLVASLLWWLVVSPSVGLAQTLVWPDRRPVAQWFMSTSSPGVRTAVNPRGWHYTASGITPQSAFTSALLTATDNVIAIMNAMNPRPQGIILWDLEGQEFTGGHYVGDPVHLSVLAPEMDAVIDQIMANLQAAGYRTGITLRPSTIMYGTTLPPTCRSDTPYANQVQWRWDAFIKTNDPAGFRWFTCLSTNNWVQEGEHIGSVQSMYDDNAVITETLRSKMDYAITRWGVSMFYIDSTLYSNNQLLVTSIWETLAAEFPDILMIPEHSLAGYFNVAADYWLYNGASFCPLPPADVDYPDSFCVINALAQDLTNPAVRTKLIGMFQQGSFPFVHGWWADPVNGPVLELWRRAQALPLTIGSTTSGPTVTINSNGSPPLEAWGPP